MSFNPKNPIYSPEVSSDPSSPPAGTRGLYPKSDGWYDINGDGFTEKIVGKSYVDAALEQKADKTSVDEINVTLEQNSEALSVLKQRSIPHTKVSGYPISVTDHLDAEQVIDYKVYGNSVQDGTPSTENPIEIKSVGDLVTDEASEYYGKYDIPVNVRGKNIFSGLTKGIGLNTSNGSEVTNKDYSVSGYIPVNFNVNTNYLISGLPTTISTLIAAYNINKEFLGRTQSLRTSKKQITSDIFINGTPQATGDVVYLRVMCYANNPAVETVDDIDGCKIQLEIGDTATEYEPYNSGETKHIYLDEPLRKVGDYADYVDFENQKVIRQVEVLDDTGAKTIDESLGLLDTPTEEIITIPELTTLISSVANVSTFTTIKPSNMEVTYYQDINKKIAELQAAITALGGI